MLYIPATTRSYIQEMSKDVSSTTKELEDIVDMTALDVAPNSPYYGLLWGNKFMQFKPTKSTKNVFVRFSLPNVLSNMPYDIYVVAAPALANDSNATSIERLPTKFDATLCYPNEDGKKDSTVLVTKQETAQDIIDYIRISPEEGFKFPCCTYALNETTPQVSLKIETNVTNLETRRNTFTRTMNINCVLVIPHGISVTDENAFYIMPHGDGEVFYISKGTDINNLEEE